MPTEFFIQGSTKERPVDYLELPNVEFAQARQTCQKRPMCRERDVPKKEPNDYQEQQNVEFAQSPPFIFV